MTNRRDFFLASAGTLAAASWLPGSLSASETNRKRVLRLAHLTDIHVQPERAAEAGMTACLHHVQGLDDAPQLILSGGDSVMDVFGRPGQARCKAQREIWQRVLKDECSLPVRPCIGNHDVHGWGEGMDADGQPYGKRYAEEMLAIEKRYYSFDSAGWHFVVLDSTQPRGGNYTAGLDPEQFEWLSEDLKKTPAETPVLVLSHIPILAVCVFFDGNNESSGDWKVPGSWMHVDARKIGDLFAKHPNVKLCLSGHIHLTDRVEYRGVTYCCNGAVSGAWWRGKYHDCDAGYGLVDLYDDGTFENQYVNYGWQHRAS
jgi:3',5'-cyclic AMP phosphodiesterase CpdA